MNIIKDGLSIKVLFEKTNNKTTRILFKENLTVVTRLRYHGTEKEAIEYIYKRFDKIYDHLLKLQNTMQSDVFYLFGIPYHIIKEHGNKKALFVGENVFLYSLDSDYSKAIIFTYVDAWNEFLDANQNYIKSRLDLFNIKPTVVKYRVTKTKLGSYHYKTKVIHINPLVARYSKNVMMYVLLHEYAHVIESNHKEGFYKLLFELYPHYLQAKKEIKKYCFKMSL